MRSSRIVRLAERRQALVKLLVALLVARIVTTAAELTEQKVGFFTILITVALAVEAWRAYAVTRRAGTRQAAEGRSGIPELPERILSAFERFGPTALYAFTGVFVVAYGVFELTALSNTALLDFTAVAREATTVVFVAILVLGYVSLPPDERRSGRPRKPPVGSPPPEKPPPRAKPG